MEHQQIPPAYSESGVPPPAFSEQPPQSPGYNQEQSLNVGQGYNVGQSYNVGQTYNVGQGYNVAPTYNVGQGYNVVQPAYVANPGCSQIFYSCQPSAVQTNYGNYRSRQSRILGTGQIIIGILCIIFNAVLIGVSGTWSLGVIAHGIWGGVLFIITGAFGVSGGKTKNKCLIVTYMILCILAAMAAAVIFSLAIVGLVIGGNEYSYSSYYSGYYPYYSSYYRVRPDNYAAAMAMNVLLVILSAIVGIMSILGSTLCCRAGCCTGPQTTNVTASQPVQFLPVNGNQQILFVTQPGAVPQYSPYPGYPIQLAAAAPAYQPAMQPGVGQINQGFAGQAEQKRQIDEIPNSTV